MTLYDALSYAGQRLLTIVPFLIGWQYLGTARAHREIFKALLAAGLAYSVLMLFEVRMSPQLHKMVYGYFPHSFAQQVRWGGFRPVVFMNHGLTVAFFAMTVFIAALALWRDSKQVPPRTPTLYSTPSGYLGVRPCPLQSLASLLYGLCLLPVVLLLKTRRQVWIAAVLVLISLSYPILRGAHLVPTETRSWNGPARSIARAATIPLRPASSNEDQPARPCRGSAVLRLGHLGPQAGSIDAGDGRRSSASRTATG